MGRKSLNLSRLVVAFKPAREIYFWIGNRWASRNGLQPLGTYWYSSESADFSQVKPRAFPAPNLSGGFYLALVAYWEHFGLGRNCLLVSETGQTKKLFEARYPKVTFATTDLHWELQDTQGFGKPDIVWNVCLPHPQQLEGKQFDSIICQALLEHVIDPTTALINMLTLLTTGGYLYLQTHTPSFMLHRYPRDYVRFHHDYFEDLPAYVRGRVHVSVAMLEMYSNRGFVAVCYRREGQ